MKYLVIEIQNNGGTVSNICTAYATKNAAEAAYHTILAAAAVSSVDVHTAVMIDEEGGFLKAECFKHED